jgi:hypothetical protein
LGVLFGLVSFLLRAAVRSGSVFKVFLTGKLYLSFYIFLAMGEPGALYSLNVLVTIALYLLLVVAYHVVQHPHPAVSRARQSPAT